MLDKSTASAEYGCQICHESTNVLEEPQCLKSGYTSSRSDSGSDNSVSDLPRGKSAGTYPALEGGWAWTIVLSGFITHVLTRGCLFSTGILFSEWTSFFGKSKSDTAWIGSIATGCGLMLGPLASRVIEKWGYRATAMLGGAISSIGFLASYWANGVYFLYLSYGLLAGTGMGISYLCSVVAVGEYFDERRSVAFGISASGAGCGAAVMAVLQRVLLREYGWRGTMIILAGVSGLNQIAFGALLRPLSSSLNWTSKASRMRLLTHGRAESATDSMTQSSEMSHHSGSKQGDEHDGPPDIYLTVHGETEIDDSSSQNECDDEDGDYRNLKVSLVPRERTSSDSGTHVKEAMSPSLLLRRKLKIAYGSNPSSPTLPTKPRMAKSQVHLVESRENISDSTNTIAVTGHISANHRINKSAKSLRISVGDAMYLSSLSISTSHAEVDKILSKQDLISSDRSDLEEKEKNDYEAKFAAEDDALMNMGATERRFPPVLRNPLFMILALSQFFTGLGVMVPFVHLTEKAILMGISDSEAAYLVAFIGIGNVIGKIILGLLCDMKFTDIFVVFLSTQLGMTIAVSMFPIFTNYSALMFASFLFGFFYGNYSAIPSLTAEYVGLHNLAQAIGYITFLEGAAGIIGPPLAGAIYDASLNYNVAFAIAALFLFISVLVLLPQPFLYKRIMGKSSSLARIFHSWNAEESLRVDDDRLVEETQRNKRNRSARDCNANYLQAITDENSDLKC